MALFAIECQTVVLSGRVGYTTAMNDLGIIGSWLGTGSINLFGLPFAGKDTHGRELAEFFKAPPVISGGDILRNSHIPPHVKTQMEAGFLAPTNEFIEIITPYLSSATFQGKPLVLSSVGRWIGEEQGVIGALEASNHPLRAVVYLNIDKSTMLQRWGKSQEEKDRGDRADDAANLLDTRYKEFQAKTLPVIDYYRQQGLLIEIDSRIPKADVTAVILAELLKKAA